MLSFPAVATVATLEKISLNLDNLCLAYLRLLYFAKLVAFQEAVATQSAAKHKTPYPFSFEVAFIYFKTSEAVLQAGLYKAKLLGEFRNFT